MSDTLKKTVYHGLETLGVLVATFVLSFVVEEVIPQFPDVPAFAIIGTLCSALVKYLRANPNINFPDYVNNPK